MISVKTGDIIEFDGSEIGIPEFYGNTSILRSYNYLSLYDHNTKDPFLITIFTCPSTERINKVYDANSSFKYKWFMTDCANIYQEGEAYLDYNNDLVDKATGEIVSLGNKPNKYIVVDPIEDKQEIPTISKDDELLNDIYDSLGN